MDERRALWLIALLLLMLAPFGLYFGVAWYFVAFVMAFETAMTLLLAYWMKRA
jgi:hypothetical protein